MSGGWGYTTVTAARALDLRADARQVALHVRDGHVAAEQQPARQVAAAARVGAQELRDNTAAS